MSELEFGEHSEDTQSYLNLYREWIAKASWRGLRVFLISFLLTAWFQWSFFGQPPRAVFQFDKRENPHRHEISSDGRFVFTWSNFPDMEMPRFRVLDANSEGELQELWSETFGDSDLAVLSPELSTLAFFDAYPQPKLLLRDVSDGRAMAEWISPHQMTKDSMVPVRHEVIWSPTGNRLALYGNDYGRVSQVYVLTVPDLRLELTMPMSTRPVFTSDGMQIVVQQLAAPEDGSQSEYASSQRRIGWSIWDLRTRRKQSFVKGSTWGQLAMPSRDAITLVIGDDVRDSERAPPGVRLIDPLNGELIAEYPEATLVNMSRDGNWILLNEPESGQSIRDALTGKEWWHNTQKSGKMPQIYTTEDATFPFVGLVNLSLTSGRYVLQTLDQGRVVQQLPAGEFGQLKFTPDFRRTAELVRNHDPTIWYKGKRIAVYDLPPVTNWPLVLRWSLLIAASVTVAVEICWQVLISRLRGDALFPGWE